MEKIESVGLFIDLMFLIRSGIDTLIFGIISSRQFGNLTVIPSDVVAHIPGKIFALYSHCIDIKFNSFIFHFTHVSCNLIGEVGACRCTDSIQQVFGMFLIIFDATIDAIIQETIVDGEIIGRGLFPFQVGAVAIWFQ